MISPSVGIRTARLGGPCLTLTWVYSGGTQRYAVNLFRYT